MQTPYSPFKSGHIGIKNVQCTETYEKTILWFFFVEIIVDFLLKILEELTKISPEMTKLLSLVCD